MDDPTWLAITGAVLGAIGAITGIIGAVISVKSYRMANSIKALDLRIEAHRARNDLQADVGQLADIHGKAMTSRKAVLSARGLFRSSIMQRCEDEWKQDQERLAKLSAQVPSPDFKYDGLSPPQLEARLVELHRTQRSVRDLARKYQEWQVEDERSRARLAENPRTR